MEDTTNKSCYPANTENVLDSNLTVTKTFKTTRKLE